LLRRTCPKDRQKRRNTLKLNLKDVELDEGETCQAKIVIYAKDTAGIILDKDESESFWIEGGVQIEPVIKKVRKIRNRAEAILYATHKMRKPIEIDSENWEEGNPRLYRINLKAEIFIELQSIIFCTILKEKHYRPMNGGAWRVDARTYAFPESS
jgi:hypothetical protein